MRTSAILSTSIAAQAALATLASGVATGLSLALSPVLAQTPSLLYFVAVAGSALVGGSLAGAIAIVLCALSMLYFFIEPTQTFQLTLLGALQLSVFLIASGLVGMLVSTRRRIDSERLGLLRRERIVRAEAEAAQQRATFLAEAGSLFATTVDYRQALRQVARLSVPKLADWCIVDVLEEDGSLRRLAVEHADPDKQGFAREFIERYPRLAPQAPHTLWKVLRPEQPWFDPNVSEERLVAEARDPEHLRLLRALGYRSEMVVPLVARGRTLGGMTFVRGEPHRPYGAEDLALADELARRAALAAENARLFAEAQRLNAELEARVIERTLQLEQKVAEHELALQALRERDRRLAEAQQIAQLGIWRWDLRTDQFAWSDVLYDIYGMRPQAESISFDRFIGLVHPDDRASVVELMNQGVRQQQPFSFDHRIVRPDGSLRVLHERATLTHDLDGLPATLEGTAQDISARHQLEVELIRSREELRQLSDYIQTAREEERARIAREIHDELGGNLTGLKMDVARLRRMVTHNDPAWASQADNVSGAIDRTVQTVRRIATELRPAILDDFGLVAAIEWQLREFESRSGIACQLDCEMEQVDIERESATAVFRVFQETLTNVARHAEASRVDVLLSKQAEHLLLEVRDNGRGISPSDTLQAKTFGLLGMRERVHILGGSLDIRGQAGQGTTVSVKIPAAANGRSKA